MRLYFHLHECGAITIDEEGMPVASIEEARDRAITQARAIMSAEVLAGKLCLNCHVNVEDDQGNFLLRVAFRDAIEISGLPSAG